MADLGKEGLEREDQDVAHIMGFASFGKATKVLSAVPSASKTKTGSSAPASSLQVKDSKELPTDYMKVFEESLRLARERNQQQQPDRSHLIGPALPPASVDMPETNASEKVTTSKEKEKSLKKDKKHKKEKKKDRKKVKEKGDEQQKIIDAALGDCDDNIIGPAIPDCFKAMGTGNSASDPAEQNKLSSETQDEKGKQGSGGDEMEEVDEEVEEEEAGEADEEVGSDETSALFVPRTSQISLDHRTKKPVVALGVDSSGSRLVSGGNDFSLRYWNFAGMDSGCRPFKILDQPCGTHQIRFAGFNCTSDCVLVVSGSAQLRLYSREGQLLSESVKGYQYISNPRSTPGHTHALLGAAWHPRDGAEFMTVSMDNSLRLWDPNNTENIMQEIRLKSCKEVIVPKSAQGRAVTPTACTYYPDGNLVFCGCTDGSLQSWDRRKPFVNNSHVLRNAHGADTVTCLAFSYDSQCLLSRSMDDTLKLWDIRQFNMPLFIKSDLSTQYEQTACGFAPNDRLFFTATSAPAKLCEKDGRSPGQLLFFDRSAVTSSASASPTADVLACNFDSGVIRCTWHAKINQLLLSTANGRVCVLFDPQRSVNGARLCAAKPAKRGLDQDSLAYKGGFVRESILTFDEQTMREVRQGKRKSKFYEHEAANAAHGPRKVYQAEAPLSGPGYGGKLGQKGGTLHQYMLQQMVKRRGEDPAEKDIRGAILRHQDEAVKNPMWTGVYAKTQPKPIFQSDDEQGGVTDGADESKKRRLF